MQKADSLRVAHLYFLLREGMACSALSVSDLEALMANLSSVALFCLPAAGRINLLNWSFSLPMV